VGNVNAAADRANGSSSDGGKQAAGGDGPSRDGADGAGPGAGDGSDSDSDEDYVTEEEEEEMEEEKEEESDEDSDDDEEANGEDDGSEESDAEEALSRLQRILFHRFAHHQGSQRGAEVDLNVESPERLGLLQDLQAQLPVLHDGTEPVQTVAQLGSFAYAREHGLSRNRVCAAHQQLCCMLRPTAPAFEMAALNDRVRARVCVMVCVCVCVCA
jgi:hypothetical protein